jgi:2-polyprenyl-3-methyl-5-hydroxy-6-metoxy-1,4-benzoquinol methylase
MGVADSLVGVDISQDGLDLLRERLPGEYVHGDVERLDSVALPRRIDLVIASELIEHLPNPGAFLTGLRGLLADRHAEALVTTPNSYGWVSFAKLAVRRREPVHPDHLMVYSPYTLAQTLRVSGLELCDLWVHDWARGSALRERLRQYVSDGIGRFNPYLGVGLVARVRAADG